MVTSLRGARASVTGAHLRGGHARDSAPSATLSLAVGALRSLTLLLAALWWLTASPAQLQLLALAFCLAGANLLVFVARPLPSSAALLADAAAIALLVHATGGTTSPFLTLPLILVALGAVAGGSRDALVGGGGGVLALLSVCLAGPEAGRAATLAMAGAQAAVAVGTAWSLESLGIGRADDEADEPHDSGEAERALGWQRLNMAAVHACDTVEELTRRVVERAMTIAGAAATVSLTADSQTARERDAAVFPIVATGVPAGELAVYAARGALTLAQREALEHLAALAAMRAGELLATQRAQRLQEAMLALWEAAGIVRMAPGLDDTMRDACRRLARALDLDWLAVLGPCERQPIAPLLMVQGRPGAAPRLHSAQLRVAAEALRAGRPLVRAEGDSALACLPMRLQGDAPLVLAACGDTSEAGTQALLMVFGDLVASGMRAEAA